MGDEDGGAAVGRRGAGRPLVGLSIVLDGRLAAREAASVAGLAGRLGFGVWWREPPLCGTAAADPAVLITTLAEVAGGATAIPGARRAGLIVDLDAPGRAGALTVPAWACDVAAEGVRLALTGQPEVVVRALHHLPGTVRDRAAIDYRAAAAVPPAGPLLVPVRATGDLDDAIAVATAAGAPADGPVIVELPVSIGRTAAEAQARAGHDTLFAVTGHPASHGLFGTLEQCQYRAAELAYVGVTELLCHLPNSRDLPDVLAQLRAVAAVGSHVLRPDEPPSPAPPPPIGWGGRRVAKADTRQS